MKKLITILGVFSLCISSFAQSPAKFSYQAVVRDDAGMLVSNSLTPIQISIIQTTISGSAVYVETHTPTTNLNGLLSIEVGAGTLVSGSINTVDWEADNFYIKSEIDVNNDANYDVTGISQLISVPYALHANSLTGGINADYIASLVARIEALENPSAAPAVVGEFRDGGVVIWVDPADDQHGLVCAVTDLGAIMSWGCHGTDIPGANSYAIGNGLANTTAIVGTCTTVGIAAELAFNATMNGYSDWYLPTNNELNEMYSNRVVINSTATANGGTAFLGTYGYWSSTQTSANGANMRFFDNGNTVANAKGGSGRVRAVRAF